MKKYKQIITGFIVIFTILGLLSFYFPGRDFSRKNDSPKNDSSNESSQTSFSDNSETVNKNDMASSASAGKTAAETVFSPEEMTGFNDLGEENELLKNLGIGTSSPDIEEMLKGFEE